MGVYSSEQIRQAIEDGHIICQPFTPKLIGNNSLYVTLGYHYYRVEQSNERAIYNPFDQEEVERYFDGPFKAMPHKAWCAQNGFKPVTGIPEDHPIIAIKPGEYILAHTHEFFGVKAPGIFTLHSHSSWARNGIVVCLDTGWIDPGYINRLPLVIYNLNRQGTVLLPVGERIAQAVFYEAEKSEDKNSLNGDPQQRASLDALIKTWIPSMMLPKAHYEHIEIPGPIEGLSYE